MFRIEERRIRCSHCEMILDCKIKERLRSISIRTYHTPKVPWLANQEIISKHRIAGSNLDYV